MRLVVIGIVALAAMGCSGGDDSALDNAAPKAASTANAPPPVPGKTVNKMGALTGPNAGKGGIPGE